MRALLATILVAGAAAGAWYGTSRHEAQAAPATSSLVAPAPEPVLVPVTHDVSAALNDPSTHRVTRAHHWDCGWGGPDSKTPYCR